VRDYLAAVEPLGITGGAVVSGSFQGLDQGYLAAALEALGPKFVGVTQLPADVTDGEVRRLHALGVRAVRFNVKRGGSAPLADLERLARRVFDLVGWHVELYLDAAAMDADLEARITALPRASVDHLGLSQAGLPAELRLVKRGVKVKATGFGRGDVDAPEALRRIAAVDPSALLFGTDLPSTRARRPFHPADVGLVRDALGPELSRRALHDNAAAWYGLPASTPGADAAAAGAGLVAGGRAAADEAAGG
jgi:predicted TIM-barrel fold metal-dependent hydrolase